MLRNIIVIPASKKDDANARMRQADIGVEAGWDVFFMGLSPNANAPITHYWCGWSCDQALSDKLATIFGPGNGYNAKRFVDVPSDNVLATEGLKRIPRSVK